MVKPLVGISGVGFNRQKLEVVKDQVKAGLVDLGKLSLETCGKRRPGDEDAGKLLRTKRAVRKASP
jgi:hypothetical protein